MTEPNLYTLTRRLERLKRELVWETNHEPEHVDPVPGRRLVQLHHERVEAVRDTHRLGRRHPRDLVHASEGRGPRVDRDSFDRA
jgi:hypothetical protein